MGEEGGPSSRSLTRYIVAEAKNVQHKKPQKPRLPVTFERQGTNDSSKNIAAPGAIPPRANLPRRPAADGWAGWVEEAAWRGGLGNNYLPAAARRLPAASQFTRCSMNALV